MQVILAQMAEQLKAQITAKLPSSIQNRIAVDDVLHNVWQSCFESFPRAAIWEERALAGWVQTIMNCRIVDAVREYGRRGAREVLIEEFKRDDSTMEPLLAAVAGNEKTPSRVASSREAIDSLHLAIASLPRERQRVIWLRHIEGRSREEIAERLGKPVSAVNSLLFHAMRQLRREMGEASRFFSDMTSLRPIPAVSSTG